MGVTYNYGAGPTYTKIGSQTLGSGTVDVTFSNIPQNYTDLLLVCSVQGTSTTDRVWIRFNSDSGNNYSWNRLTGNGSSAGAASYQSQPAIETGDFVPNSGSSFLISTTNIQNYSNSTTYKPTLTRYSIASNFVAAVTGLWRNTNAITSITSRMSANNNTLAGSTFTLYGVAAALKPKATGGTVTFDPATSKWVHTFTSSGAFTPTQGLTADYLVVAGGGGGGATYGGGGGAGGLRSTVTATGGGGSLESALSLTAGTAYTVTVGAGGVGTTSIYLSTPDSLYNGTNGSNSVFSSITSTGGGGGSNRSATAGSGGSSGGGGGVSGTAGTRTASPVQGFNGAAGAANGAGGGGGGASAAGVAASSGTVAGNGGTGAAVSITGSSVSYAGGGGGGVGNGTAGTGGAGGGANGRNQDGAGGTGTVNSGGGGGGGGGYATEGTGGNGGSGIVIVRYSA